MTNEEKELVINDFEDTLNYINTKRGKSSSRLSRLWAINNTVFERISGVYSFTNELLKQYNKQLNYKDKQVLTVTASSDQVITAMMHKAKNIDTFDCNKLTYYHMFFKIAAIKTLSYNEFIKLYSNDECYYNDDYLICLYTKLRDYICKEDVKYYWDMFFKSDQENFRYLFLGAKTFLKDKINNIDFLEEDKYYKAKQTVSNNVSFKNIDVFDITKEYNKKYDFINLSNIMTYNNLKKYVLLIKEIMNNNLNDKGIILADYLWHEINSNCEQFQELNNMNCNPSIINVTTSNNPKEESNSVILCKKKKTI